MRMFFTELLKATGLGVGGCSVDVGPDRAMTNNANWPYPT